MLAGAGASGRFDAAHGTHASFGARGDRVIVTYHGDHAYSFDVTAAGGDPVAVYGGSSVHAGADVRRATLALDLNPPMTPLARSPPCAHNASVSQISRGPVCCLPINT